MKRRDFLSLTAASALMPIAARAGSETLRFTPGVVAEQLAAGHTVFIDFYTDWCPTCRVQKRTIAAIRGEFPIYNEKLVFVKVNWDIYSRSDLAKKHKIPRRSTLLLLQGNIEIGRIVAGTSRDRIQALMDAGVAIS